MQFHKYISTENFVIIILREEIKNIYFSSRLVMKNKIKQS